MLHGLDLTFDLLAETLNKAAEETLLRGLESSHREVPERALKALMLRRSPHGAAAILARWHTLPDHWKLLVRDCAGWLTHSIRSAALGHDEQLYRNACDAALATHDYDLAPVFVAAAEDQANPFAAQAAEAALLLAEQLHDEMHAPRDYRERRDPARVRAFIVAALEKAVGTFPQHERRELLEAFLLLAGRDNPLLRHILQNPYEREFPPLAEALVASSRPGVIRLLLHLLDDPLAPHGALKLLGRRRDVSFLRQFLRKIGAEPTATVVANLRRIDAVSWLNGAERLLGSLSEAEQAGAVHLVALSHTPRDQALEFIEVCLQKGAPPARRAAAAALENIALPRVAKLVQRAIADADPQVRASLAPLLRKSGLVDAVPRLLAMLDSPHAVERDSARLALHEFEFARFLAAFDGLDSQARQSTGRLVRQVDPQALPSIAAELAADSRTRRRRGLELTLALNAVSELTAEIAVVLRDEDPYLRLEAVRTLSADDSPAIRQYLREALLDAHPLVQHAAEETLVRRTRSVVPTIAAAPVALPNSPAAPGALTT